MVLLITYDLNQPGQQYNDLYEEIRKAGTWWHYLDSTWIIETNQNPQYWTDRLSKHLDENDCILIIEVCENRQGLLPKRAWDWLRKRNFRC